MLKMLDLNAGEFIPQHLQRIRDLSIIQKSSSASEAHPASPLSCRSAKFVKKSMLICTGTHACLWKSCHQSTRTVPCTSTEDYSFKKALWKSHGPAHQLLRSMRLLRALSFFTGHTVWSLQGSIPIADFKSQSNYFACFLRIVGTGAGLLSQHFKTWGSAFAFCF